MIAPFNVHNRLVNQGHGGDEFELVSSALCEVRTTSRARSTCVCKRHPNSTNQPPNLFITRQCQWLTVITGAGSISIQ